MLKQHLQLKLSQKLSPQQIQLMKLIQLPVQSFEQQILKEVEENPALETGSNPKNENVDENFKHESDNSDENEINVDSYLQDDSPDYLRRDNNFSQNDKDKSIPYASGISFHEQLMSQLDTFKLSSYEYKIASFLVGSIDSSGYIRREIIDIVDDLAFTQNIETNETDVRSILNKVQELDPAGVGALNLKECLLIQLKRKTKTNLINDTIAIVSNQFEAFTKKHFSKIKSKLNFDDDKLRLCIKEIEKLNPKPGASLGINTKINSQIVPDFTVLVLDGELKLLLNSRNIPELHVSNEYKNMLMGYKESKTKDKRHTEAVQFIKQKLDSAKWFIDAIKQRQNTLRETMSKILDFQKDYFLTGDEQRLKPMILKDIAELIKMDISTVSRVANSKYVETPYGTKLVKWFFSEAIVNSKGQEISTIEVKKVLSEIIKSENKSSPYTDEELMKKMVSKGYPIARRTVAKYRDMIGAPVARLRRKL